MAIRPDAESGANSRSGLFSSAVSPDQDSAMITSSLVIMPRSPWLASRRMDEEGRRAGGGERGGDLAADVAGLAHAGDDQAAAARRADQVDGGLERLRQVAPDRRDEGRDAASLGLQRAQRAR